MAEYSPAPGTPQTYTKAVWAVVVAFIVAGGPTLWLALSDNHISAQEAVAFILAGLGAPVATGVTVAKVKNKARNPRERV